MRKEYIYGLPRPYRRIVNAAAKLMMACARNITPIMEEMDGDQFELTDGKYRIIIVREDIEDAEGWE